MTIYSSCGAVKLIFVLYLHIHLLIIKYKYFIITLAGYWVSAKVWNTWHFWLVNTRRFEGAFSAVYIKYSVSVHT